METRPGDAQNVDVEKFLQHIKTVVRDGQQLLRVGIQRFGERAQSSASSTNRLVRENPYPSVGVAFGVGLIVGYLAHEWFRRRSEEPDT